jgi:hypothetical protein
MKLYVTDIDNTILPADRSKFQSSDLLQWQERVKKTGAKMGYVTGRHFELALEILDVLPEPDFLITAVGTRIHWKKDGDWREDKDYLNYIGQIWQGCSGDDARQALAGLGGLKEQGPEAQSRFKQSYYLDASYNADEIVENIKNILGTHQLASEVIYSVDDRQGRGMIDILPKGVAKSGAIRFLMRELDYGLEDVLYSGDSGNDLDALTMGSLAVLVGNARPEIKEKVKASAPYPGRIYRAKAPYIQGVLEGFDHFRV